jgi:uncharacterized cupin superfamily protein
VGDGAGWHRRVAAAQACSRRLARREPVVNDEPSVLADIRRRKIMAGIQSGDFDSPDETRTPEKTRVDVVRLGDTTAGRFTFEPGWKWSECIKPVAGTESCQARHVGVVQSGRMRVTHEDGTEMELGPGDAYVIEPGHDAEVLGDERFVGFEFESRSAEEYARE